MNRFFCVIFILAAVFCYGQDSQVDYSKINEQSQNLEHLLPLFTIHGVPKNQNVDDSLAVLINHGYCLGFSTKYNQPLWAAYQVSKSKEAVDYERFPFFVDDLRLDEANRIGTKTFGGGFDLGHLVPNAAINKQYGKLSQMETFMMSNISPQKAGLNRGVWQKLEAEILNKYPNEKGKEHVWVIVGPVFSENPEYIERGKKSGNIAIPDAFFCILIRPRTYPQDSPGSSDYLAFLFPQDLEQKQKLDVKFIVSINEIEKLTRLNFFPEFSKAQEAKIETAVATELW
ncbi:DNA/RNA non-specific endonuclease [Bacteroidales bacterium OttesenSCG-928-B11]|nr:DNA/RNA non-specific endonuclease [Bacteroidales bacterium OttesenSCG-928-E04]MDL2308741.1 DNA/RNA non-specific endonuclease [Bacteroidales bacterium OttesenSCG-928-C03]MDL2312311.1 DNA/RNA non-specific endonuclease [Bacteroidales bacterium OttesenSCG-928-B11]MDL2326450.1 DNA/RNA non-specific endonuclease [Bacteroidales bacterium OttesenSCG-928-A14]